MNPCLDAGAAILSPFKEFVSIYIIKVYNIYEVCYNKIMKTVFTNGCFDILHRGHLDYLKESAFWGERLIIGINSDSSVRKLKGSDRPINKQEDRKFALECLSFVTRVYIFDEPTPYELIKYIRPDIITKGGDYVPDNVIGNDLARVKIIPYTIGYSTTEFIERIRND